MDNESSQVDNSSQAPSSGEPVDVQSDPSSQSDATLDTKLPPEPIEPKPQPIPETINPDEAPVASTLETPQLEPPSATEPLPNPIPHDTDIIPVHAELPADTLPANPIPIPVQTITSPPPEPTQPTAETIIKPDQLKLAVEPNPGSNFRDKIHALSDEELRYAATYYLQKNQKTISAKGVEARKQQMENKLNTIFIYLSAHGDSPLPRIAKHINCSPGTTSHYLQQLIRRGQVCATGWASKRVYRAN